MSFRPGPLSAPDAARLNDLLRRLAALEAMRVAPPMTLQRAAGVPLFGVDLPAAVTAAPGYFAYLLDEYGTVQDDSGDTSDAGTVAVGSYADGTYVLHLVVTGTNGVGRNDSVTFTVVSGLVGSIGSPTTPPAGDPQANYTSVTGTGTATLAWDASASTGTGIDAGTGYRLVTALADGTGPWNVQPLTLDAGGAEVADGDPTTDYPAVPLTIDGAGFATPPVAGLRAWVIPSKQVGYDEFLPLGTVTATGPVLLAEVTVSSGEHTVKRKTVDAGTDAIVDVAGPVTYGQCVSTTGVAIPVGTLVWLDPIPDLAGFYWITPAAHAASGLPGLMSELAQTVTGPKTWEDEAVFDEWVRVGGGADPGFITELTGQGNFGDTLTAVGLLGLYDAQGGSPAVAALYSDPALFGGTWQDGASGPALMLGGDTAQAVYDAGNARLLVATAGAVDIVLRAGDTASKVLVKDCTFETTNVTNLAVGGMLGCFGVAAVGQQAGGVATAGGTYTAAEQAMIQSMYDALRSYGLLS